LRSQGRSAAPLSRPHRAEDGRGGGQAQGRTLTNFYNQRPRWLADAHDALDRAVAVSYGWPEDISTEDALARLLALNLERARAQK
jgi:hypothetical protein